MSADDYGDPAKRAARFADAHKSPRFGAPLIASETHKDRNAREEFPPDPPGTAEGELCRRDGCCCRLTLEPSLNCSCHITPPCGSCLDVRVHCEDCGWRDE